VARGDCVVAHVRPRRAGRRPNGSTLVGGVLLAGALHFLPLTLPLQNALGSAGLQAGLQELSRMPVWFRVILGATGGMVEETLYRGYAVERLAMITGRPWLAGILSAVAFGLAHIPAWGMGFAIAADLPYGIVMTIFYLWRRDLLANILAHSAGLVVAMLRTVP
jgi:uncharacterized protein